MDKNRKLFWGCFVALIATAFGFIIRALIIDDWATQFGLTETQKGEIFGVGLWPFAISIVIISLFIDRIGYGKAMVFAFICHVASAIITIFATGYWSLYIGTFIVALGNGAVEAVINPVVATMFSKEKTKWLNILHAGWPGGLVLGGLLTIFLGYAGVADWRIMVGLIFIPTVLYAVLMLGAKFPIQERVLAGVTHKDMLKQAGFFGALIVVGLIVFEVGRVFDFSMTVKLVLIAVLAGGFAAYAQSLGRPMFIFLLLIMIPLATTELGTDSWITDLMKPVMGGNAGWVLVYTSFIMMMLRFYAGPIVHRLSPLGLLCVSCVLAATGLVLLSRFETAALIFVAATVYGFGKTFFWPTMLGVVAEQFPKGGALTLNATGGVGMLGVGVIGAALLGNIQDKNIDRVLAEDNKTLHAEVIGKEQESVFGSYRALNSAITNGIKDKVALYEYPEEMKKTPAELVDDKKWQQIVRDSFVHLAPAEPAADATAAKKDEYKAAKEAYDKVENTTSAQVSFLKSKGYFVDAEVFKGLKVKNDELEKATAAAKKDALFNVAIFPLIMLVCYVILVIYFKSKGGYQAEELVGHAAQDAKFTGGVEGPVE